MKATLCQIQLDCQAHAKAEAKRDISFAVAREIKKLNLKPEDEAMFLSALESYAVAGAARAVQLAHRKGWITIY